MTVLLYAVSYKVLKLKRRNARELGREEEMDTPHLLSNHSGVTSDSQTIDGDDEQQIQIHSGTPRDGWRIV